MPDFDSFLSVEENALFAKMADRDGNDPAYDAAVDTAIKWQAVGFRERAKNYANKLLSEVFGDDDDEALLDKVINRAKIISACRCL